MTQELDECHKAFEEWWKDEPISGFDGVTATNVWNAWQAAWNTRFTPTLPEGAVEAGARAIEPMLSWSDDSSESIAQACLTAALPVMMREKWQPIETVPDDVETILGYSFNGSQDGADCVAQITYSEGNGNAGWREATDGNRFWPTHWMPLPAPPADQPRKGNGDE